MLGEYRLGDCMDYLPDYPDNHFDLAIVDPPYGIGRDGGETGKNWKYYQPKKWDKERPSDRYFNELFRVSKNQIIWGANYFNLPPSMGWVFWDKGQELTMSDGELAFTSFDRALRKYTLNRVYIATNGQRIHPTQKPIKLYKWLLKNYAKEGDLILDTHVGSASSLIACEDMGFNYVGYEKDPDYYRDSTKRLKQHIAQLKIF